MYIKARVSGATIILESNPVDKSAREQSVVFELLSARGDDLDLDTGEVFQDISYTHAKKLEKKLIYATMTVYPRKDSEDYVHNTMSYIDEHKSDHEFDPAKIFFNVRIPPQTFRELAENAKSKLLPSEIWVGFEGPSFFRARDEPPKVDPLQYGGAPDGSSVIWHTKNTGVSKLRVSGSITLLPRLDTMKARAVVSMG